MNRNDIDPALERAFDRARGARPTPPLGGIPQPRPPEREGLVSSPGAAVGIALAIVAALMLIAFFAGVFVGSAHAQPRGLEGGADRPEQHGAAHSEAPVALQQAVADTQPDRATFEPAPQPIDQQIARSLLERMVIWTNPRSGGPTYILHCRRAREGCVRRIERASFSLARAAEERGVDPWLLASIALRESGMNPQARGDAGELGLMQLHPLSRAGVWAERECRRAPSSCDAIVIDAATALLARGVRTCGSEFSALVFYNAGRCAAEADGASSAGSPGVAPRRDEPPGYGYARAVLRLRDELRGGAS